MADFKFLACEAKAKINLFLHVIGRRTDGYHLLQGVFAKLSLADRIRISKSDRISCHVIGPFSVIGDNIASRAAYLLQSVNDIKQGAEIFIEKNIPVAAGLGGGSADAAAVLQILSRQWCVELNAEIFNRIGLQLGADVPFCLQDSCALVEGIGEIITPIALGMTLELLLINNGEHISSKQVYTHYQRSEFTQEKQYDAHALVEHIMHGRNDLEDMVLQLYPTIREVLHVLKEQDECSAARLSGSGGTCFSIFDSKSAADNALEMLSHRFPHWWIRRETLKI